MADRDNRRKVYICLGSACHIKGAEEVVKVFKRKIREHQLEDKIALKGSFCLGECSKAVVVKIGNELIGNLKPENAEELFELKVLPAIRRLLESDE